MADVKLGQNPDVGAVPQAGSDKEQMAYLLKAYPALIDAYVRLQRDLENAMQSLDSSNVKAIDGNITDVTNLDLVVNSVITNTLITQSLYAERGYIAELTVDQLDTSTKVQNYLLHDTNHVASVADVNYTKIKGQSIQEITAVAVNHPATAQATDRKGNLLYWDVIAGVVSHLATTLTANAYPVTIWTYTEQVKVERTFKLVNGVYTPQDLYGSGTLTGTNNEGKGIIYKAFTDSKNVFHVGYFHSVTGAELGFTIDDNGVHSAGILPATDMDGSIINNLYVETAFPTNAPNKAVLVDTDDYSRYDYLAVTATGTGDVTQAEFVEFTGSTAFNYTLSSTGASAVCVKKFKNSSTAIITLVGTINGSTTNVLYPNDSVLTIYWTGTKWVS